MKQMLWVHENIAAVLVLKPETSNLLNKNFDSADNGDGKVFVRLTNFSFMNTAYFNDYQAAEIFPQFNFLCHITQNCT